MRKRSGTKTRIKNASARRDATLRELATKDLGDDPRASGAAVAVQPQRPTSILLSPSLIARLRARAARLGIGYQTLLKMIVTKHLDDDL